MKIERLNESQIRCTLTSADLSSRHIKINELAYGSDKARALFSDMMQEAQTKVGFDIGSSPLMIEAIPVSPDSLVLIITKVDDPEELDARFSRFTQTDETVSGRNSEHAAADDILDLFQKIYEAKARAEEAQKNSGRDSGEEAGPATEEAPVLTQCFRFRTLDDVIGAARGLHRFYRGRNMLCKTRGDAAYALILSPEGTEPDVFNKVCNILSEYGTGESCPPAAEAYLREHGEVLLAKDALQTLAGL